MAAEASIVVTLVYARATYQIHEFSLTLPEGATLGQALIASGLRQLYPELDLSSASVGIWGRKAGLEQVLRAHDRVELYRPLRVDPKVARRERFVAQGKRGTGLFANKRRTGAAPGD